MLCKIHASECTFLANVNRVTETSPLGEKAATARLATLRHIAGIISIVAGLIVLAALITQITDQISVGRFKPEQYFAYFTIQTAMINIVVLITGGIMALRLERDTRLYTAIRASVFSYALVTAVVYNVLLRDIPNADGYVGPVWPNESLHVWIPIYIALDWLLTPGRVRIAWSALWLAVSYPLIWVGITMLRGANTGWYPYPFLEPDGPNGIVGVVTYVVGIAAFIVVLAAVAILINRVQTRGVRGVSHGRRKTGPIPVVRADLR
ncbi:MAG: hypothetical protein RL499_494 [Actinomycetota bacterium]